MRPWQLDVMWASRTRARGIRARHSTSRCTPCSLPLSLNNTTDSSPVTDMRTCLSLYSFRRWHVRRGRDRPRDHGVAPPGRRPFALAQDPPLPLDQALSAPEDCLPPHLYPSSDVCPSLELDAASLCLIQVWSYLQIRHPNGRPPRAFPSCPQGQGKREGPGPLCPGRRARGSLGPGSRPRH